MNERMKHPLLNVLMVVGFILFVYGTSSPFNEMQSVFGGIVFSAGLLGQMFCYMGDS